MAAITDRDIALAATMLRSSCPTPEFYEDVPRALRFMADTSANVSAVMGVRDPVTARAMQANEVTLRALALNIENHIGAMLDAQAAEQLDVEPVTRGNDGDVLYGRRAGDRK